MSYPGEDFPSGQIAVIDETIIRLFCARSHPLRPLYWGASEYLRFLRELRSKKSIETQNIDQSASRTFVQCIVQLELIHDQLPLAVPCYDLFPVIEFTVGLTEVGTSGTPDSLKLTGGEYKARERIHRGVLIRDY